MNLREENASSSISTFDLNCCWNDSPDLATAICKITHCGSLFIAVAYRNAVIEPLDAIEFIRGVSKWEVDRFFTKRIKSRINIAQLVR